MRMVHEEEEERGGRREGGGGGEKRDGREGGGVGDLFYHGGLLIKFMIYRMEYSQFILGRIIAHQQRIKIHISWVILNLDIPHPLKHTVSLNL